MTIRSLTTAVSRLTSVRHRGPPPALFSLTPKVTNNVFFDVPKRFISSTKPTLMISKESPEVNPGLHTTIDNATKGYFVQQTMYRIKDPKATLDFYSRVLGMSLVKRLDWPDLKVSLYFMAYEDMSLAPSDPIERTKWMVGRKATLELAHYWEDTKAPEFKGYHNGNTDPVGYGHIGITVDDVYKACERFESLGVEFVKKPTEGDIKGVAFIKDPNGYWIEIFDQANVGKIIANAGAA